MNKLDIFKPKNRTDHLLIYLKTLQHATMKDLHDYHYYAKCMAGGLLACGITHFATVPLDVVKCRT